jgi:hypothetical protein
MYELHCSWRLGVSQICVARENFKVTERLAASKQIKHIFHMVRQETQSQETKQGRG